jgi:NADH-quinone oxidoreductase subunit C
MPDAPGLELVRAEINEAHPGAVLDTTYTQGRAALIVDASELLGVLRWLRDTPGQEYRFLSSLHAADYLPAEPRFAVHYELLNRDRVERLRVKALLADPVAAGATGAPSRKAQSSLEGTPASLPSADGEPLPRIDSCAELFPTADFQEREAYDFFWIVFRGHPDLRRILMPEDYVGWPLRRDFPVGGEPVLFTYNEATAPGAVE